MVQVRATLAQTMSDRSKEDSLGGETRGELLPGLFPDDSPPGPPAPHLYGLEGKALERWQSLASQCLQRLAGQQIVPGDPGTILKDIEILLEFVGVDGIPTKSSNASLPSERLPELNAKVGHPIKLALKRALLRDYPNLAGIFILARVMDLLQMKGNRLVVCPEALEFWLNLNPAERYFALLEALLFQAQSSVLGGAENRWDTQSVDLLVLFLVQLSDRWRNFDHYEAVRLLGPRGGIPPWKLFALQQLGVIEIRPAEFSARDRSFSGGNGWIAGGAKLTPWGSAVVWALLGFLGESEAEGEGVEQPEAESEFGDDADEAGPTVEFGALQRVFRPYFPEWQTVYARPGVDSKLAGTRIFKVELIQWRGEWGDGGVWRRLAVPPSASLDDLADAILRAFKLDDDHCYDFRYRDKRGKSRVYNDPRSDEGPFTLDVAVGEMELALRGEMLFTFDYGDNWQFKLRLEQIESGPDGPRKPKVIESAGKAPPQYPQFD
jgi:hypothetical protein